MATIIKTTGKRTILGTDWPVETLVDRRGQFGSFYWLVTWGLCNGAAERSERFTTKKAALEAAGIEA